MCLGCLNTGLAPAVCLCASHYFWVVLQSTLCCSTCVYFVSRSCPSAKLQWYLSGFIFTCPVPSPASRCRVKLAVQRDFTQTTKVCEPECPLSHQCPDVSACSMLGVHVRPPQSRREVSLTVDDGISTTSKPGLHNNTTR